MPQETIMAKINTVKAAEMLADLKTQGFEVIVAEMPDTGETRIFVDAASKFYSKKISTILPARYVKKGNRWIGVYKGKMITDKKKAAALREKAKNDPKIALRVSGKSDGSVFYKTGSIQVMTRRDAMNHVMGLRRKAGYKPVHKRPGVGQKISKAVKTSWKQGTGRYGEIKKEAAQKREK
jgi:hypothetical protein